MLLTLHQTALWKSKDLGSFLLRHRLHLGCLLRDVIKATEGPKSTVIMGDLRLSWLVFRHDPSSTVLCQPADPGSPCWRVLADLSPCSNVGLYPLDLPIPVELDSPLIHVGMGMLT